LLYCDDSAATVSPMPRHWSRDWARDHIPCDDARPAALPSRTRCEARADVAPRPERNL